MVTFVLFLVALALLCPRVDSSFWIVAGGGHGRALTHPLPRLDLVTKTEGDRGRFICPILTQTLPLPDDPPFPRKKTRKRFSRWGVLGWRGETASRPSLRFGRGLRRSASLAASAEAVAISASKWSRSVALSRSQMAKHHCRIPLPHPANAGNVQEQ